MNRLMFACAAAVVACGGPSASPLQPSNGAGATGPSGGSPSSTPVSPPAPIALPLPPLEAPNYFIHELFLEDSAHPVVRLMHNSARQPPPHATIFRWNGAAWDELPAFALPWPVPVVGEHGEVYAYDQMSPGGAPYVFEQQWRALPGWPGAPSFFLGAATVDRANGELVALLSDGSRIRVERLSANAWKQVGPELQIDSPLNPFLRVASVVAEGDAVHVAYLDGGVVTASLRRDGWAVSRPFDRSPVSDPRISLGPTGRSLVFAADPTGAGHMAISDGTGWRVLPNVVDGLQLFYGPALRDDGAPMAFFQRGFPSSEQADLAAAVWDGERWSLSQTTSVDTWGAQAFFADGTGVTSVFRGGSIVFDALHAP